jgi:hypothetical protein
MRPAISPLPKMAEGPLLRGEPGDTAVDGMAGKHNSSGIRLKGPRGIVTFYEIKPHDGAVFSFASGPGNDLCSLGKTRPIGRRRLKRLLKNLGNEGHGFTRATKDRKRERLEPLGYGLLALNERHCTKKPYLSA